ncbi:glutathione S-transferase 2-like [Styela clava]
MGKLIFGYWAPRGLGAPIRMLLVYGNIDYEEITYRSPSSGAKCAEWIADKQSMTSEGFDFPNLPYIIDGNVKITQSWAIYKYLGRKLGLMPNTDNKICQAEILEGEIQDLRTLNYSFYSPDLYEKQKEIKERQETKIEYLEKYFQGKNFCVGR